VGTDAGRLGAYVDAPDGAELYEIDYGEGPACGGYIGVQFQPRPQEGRAVLAPQFRDAGNG
jgi:hypothetical protein